MKPLKFMGDSQTALSNFPDDVKREAGFDLAAKRYRLSGVTHDKTQD
jgi:phage-related protein